MRTTKKGVRRSELKKMNLLEVIENVVELTKDNCNISVDCEAQTYIYEVAERLKLEPIQALLLSVFVDQCDDSRIQPRDIARHFDCRTISVLAKDDVIESLVQMRVIARKKDSDGDITYRVPRRTIDALKEGRLPEKEVLTDLTAKEWVNVVDDLIRQRGNDEISDDDLEGTLGEIIEGNQHLHIARQLKGLGLCYTDLLLFLAMSMLYINNHDDRIRRGDIDDYFSRGDLRSHTQDLENGSHTLMAAKLVEHSCTDGQIESDSWCLTNYSKYELYAELNLKAPANVRSNLTHYDDIKEKKLYYNPTVTKQVEHLASLLEHEKMHRVLSRLETKGMRKGFTCIFYGGPGTGKTETVMQLARMTQRDIMLVDIPSIRSKWVGEQEKNIKALFERYHKAVASAKDGNAPILLFNEADALLNKRFEGGLSCADKEENSMQNIILQEMENLEGIMIATTNLTGSLDDAFERRFLYKIEFDKPSPKERQHIWHSMLPDLTDEQALALARQFDFSGGQIENITRKRIITDILDERDNLDFDSIVESCKAELLNKKSQRSSIGF